MFARVKEKKKTTTKTTEEEENKEEREFRDKKTFYRTFTAAGARLEHHHLYRESSLVPSFDLRDEDYSVVDVNDDTQTTTTTTT